MPETPDELDSLVRSSAFAFLDTCLLHSADETIAFEVLRQGFHFRGDPVHMLGAQGIFKPAILPEMPLTVMTAPPKQGRVPYDDAVTPDGVLLYAFRKGDPNHRDNIALEKVMSRQVPLAYLRGIVPGRYLPFYPVFIRSVDRSARVFEIPLDWTYVIAGEEGVGGEEGAEPQRSYVTIPVRKRLHQASFRERVLRAYRECCAICRLRHRELLDATHILSDKHPLGEPVVSNGLSLCKFHHAAYDKQILGIRPDFRIDVRTDILAEIDGPMLLHGLQGVQGQRLIVPSRKTDQPNREFLAERYETFRRAS